MAKTVRAHMPGVVQEVLVVPGQPVAIGDQVALLESMKMIVPVEASEAGVVDMLAVKAGDTVDEDGVILTLL